jgi:hypothetical protein
MIIDWLKKNLAFILGGIFLFCMVACFVSGCRYHKNRHPCPEPTIVTNTVILHDTVTHTITQDHYIQNTDTIIYTDTIIQPVDTAAILRDFFALHVYSRNWTDSLLTVDLRDTVTQNKFLQNEFKYRILRPQTIINTTVDQSIHYNKYIYIGATVPIKDLRYAEFDVLGAFKGFYIGTGYIPQLKSLSFKGGLTLFKFK